MDRYSNPVMLAVSSFLQFFQPEMGIKLEKLLKNAIVNTPLDFLCSNKEFRYFHNNRY